MHRRQFGYGRRPYIPLANFFEPPLQTRQQKLDLEVARGLIREPLSKRNASDLLFRLKMELGKGMFKKGDCLYGSRPCKSPPPNSPAVISPRNSYSELISGSQAEAKESDVESDIIINGEIPPSVSNRRSTPNKEVFIINSGIYFPEPPPPPPTPIVASDRKPEPEPPSGIISTEKPKSPKSKMVKIDPVVETQEFVGEKKIPAASSIYPRKRKGPRPVTVSQAIINRINREKLRRWRIQEEFLRDPVLAMANCTPESEINQMVYYWAYQYLLDDRNRELPEILVRKGSAKNPAYKRTLLKTMADQSVQNKKTIGIMSEQMMPKLSAKKRVFTAERMMPELNAEQHASKAEHMMPKLNAEQHVSTAEQMMPKLNAEQRVSTAEQILLKLNAEQRVSTAEQMMPKLNAEQMMPELNAEQRVYTTEQTMPKLNAEQRASAAEQTMPKLNTENHVSKPEVEQIIPKMKSKQIVPKIMSEQIVQQIEQIVPRTKGIVPKIKSEHIVPKIEQMIPKHERIVPKIKSGQIVPKIKPEQSFPKLKPEQIAPKIKAEKTVPKINSEQIVQKIKSKQIIPKIKSEQVIPKIDTEEEEIVLKMEHRPVRYESELDILAFPAYPPVRNIKTEQGTRNSRETFWTTGNQKTEEGNPHRNRNQTAPIGKTRGAKPQTSKEREIEARLPPRTDYNFCHSPRFKPGNKYPTYLIPPQMIDEVREHENLKAQMYAEHRLEINLAKSRKHKSRQSTKTPATVQCRHTLIIDPLAEKKNETDQVGGDGMFFGKGTMEVPKEWIQRSVATHRATMSYPMNVFKNGVLSCPESGIKITKQTSDTSNPVIKPSTRENNGGDGGAVEALASIPKQHKLKKRQILTFAEGNERTSAPTPAPTTAGKKRTPVPNFYVVA